jgi:hypothetical protein
MCSVGWRFLATRPTGRARRPTGVANFFCGLLLDKKKKDAGTLRHGRSRFPPQGAAMALHCLLLPFMLHGPARRISAKLFTIAITVGLAALTYSTARQYLQHHFGRKVVALAEVVEVPVSYDMLTEHPVHSEVFVDLLNTSGEKVCVVGVNSSCGCIAPIDDFPFSLDPHQRMRVRFKIQVDSNVKDGDVLGKATLYVDESAPMLGVLFQARLQSEKHNSVARTN